MKWDFYELIAKCMLQELRNWQNESYSIGHLARIVLLGAGDKMAAEFANKDTEFDYCKFMDLFYKDHDSACLNKEQQLRGEQK
jgi:hypothetical protein